jgi:hypothetical protein
MRNEAWSEMDRTCMKKIKWKALFWTKLWNIIIKIVDRNPGAVDPVVEWLELQTVIISARNMNLCFESGSL